MFKKIARLNHEEETRELVINTNEIVALTTHQRAPIELFDINGDLVETKESPMTYELVLTNRSYKVSKETYEELVAELVK